MIKANNFLRGLLFSNLIRGKIPQGLRSAHVLTDGRGPCHLELNEEYKLNMFNPDSTIPFETLNKLNLNSYSFPKVKFHYTSQDVVTHALNVGAEKELSLLDPSLPSFQVLPSFLFTLFNKVVRDVFSTVKGMNFPNVVHGEQNIELRRPFAPEDTLTLDIRIPILLDKGSGALYSFVIEGWNETGQLFTSEYQAFEVGGGDFGGLKKSPTLVPLGVTPRSDPADSFHQLCIPPVQRSLDMNPEDSKVSWYAEGHIFEKFGPENAASKDPYCQGRFVHGAIQVLILKEYGGGRHNTRISKTQG